MLSERREGRPCKMAQVGGIDDMEWWRVDIVNSWMALGSGSVLMYLGGPLNDFMLGSAKRGNERDGG
jgi:hypothetical protein